MKITCNRNGLRKAYVVLALFMVARAAQAGTVSGVVLNGTNNKPAGGVDVLLIALQGGMQTVANTKTDVAGRYHFDNAAIGGGPMLIRAVYRGVNFHQPLVPGTPTVDVTIYEPTTDPQALKVTGRLLVFQPVGDKLLVGEEYSIENSLSPPAAYFKQDGSFEFTIPEGADLQQVSSMGPSKMPVTQGTIDKGKGRYAIAYAFQPGDNSVRLSYQIPYADNRASVRAISNYDSARVLLVAPPTMQVSSPGFTAGGVEQGFNVFSRDSVKAGTAFEVAISGTATAPSQATAESDPDPTNGRESAPVVQTTPARLDNEKWILFGGLAAIFAVGVGLLLRQPVQAVGGVAAATLPPATKAPNGRKARAVEAKLAPPALSLSELVNQEVSSNLDSLKDTLLRIELRHQAGTISEEEYARERSRAEQMLREMVQG